MSGHSHQTSHLISQDLAVTDPSHQASRVTAAADPILLAFAAFAEHKDWT